MYLRVKIADLIDHDSVMLRWRLRHDDFVSRWFVTRQETVHPPLITHHVHAPAFIELDDGGPEVRTVGPFDTPPLYRDDSICFTVILV